MVINTLIPTSSLVTDEVVNAYLESRLVITRDIRIFEADAITPWSFSGIQDRLVAGDVSVDSERDERRALNLTLANFDGALRPGSDGGFWYDKIIKTYRGLIYYVNGVKKKFQCQTGEFMIDNISADRMPKHVVVTGRDYAKKLILDQFAVDTAFTAGAKVDDIVRTVATNGGIVKFRLGAGSISVGAAPTFARGSSRWENIKAMCEGLNVEIYFDSEGYLVTRPYDDVSTTPAYFTLSMDQGKQNIVDFSKSTSDSNIFNDIVVTGTSEEETVLGYKYISHKTDTDPNSPTCIQRIGRRTFSYESPTLTSQAQADELAIRLLNVKRLEDYNLEFSTVCLPWLEAGRVLQFADPLESSIVPTRFLFSGFTIPFELGPMSGSGKRIVIVGTNITPPSEPEIS